MRVASPSGTGIHTLIGGDPIVCLVAGIGVTPALALGRHVDHHGGAQRVHIDYSARSRDEQCFAEELRDIEQRRPNISLELRLTSERGRIGPGDIEQLVADRPGANYFVCGPRPYHDDVTAALQASGVHPERVVSEEFRHAAGPDSYGGP
jgi:ferredoxin-NADP reductase